MSRTVLLSVAIALLGATLLGPAGAAANVRVGTAGWEWGNPTPTGSTLRALDFAGPRGYAVGDFGALLRTDDAGATWRGLPSGVFANLTRLQVLSPDSFVVGGGCVLRRSDDGGATFRRLYFVTPACRNGLATFTFASPTVGYVVLVDGTVVRTDDGGQTYSPRTALPGTPATAGGAQPTDLAFTAEATGVAATTQGKIFRTTDGGNSWVEVSTTNRAVRDVVFVSATRGYAVGDGSLFLVTADGGATWTPRSVGGPQPVDLTALRCTGTTVCLAASRRGDVIVRTTDGGATFSLVSASTDPVFAVAFASATRVVAGGQAGATVVSDDAGTTFARIGGRLSGRYLRLRATPAGVAFATGENGGLARSTDGGQSWSRVGVPTSEDVLDVSFGSAQVGYALDVQGQLFRSANAGTSWQNIDTGSTARPGAVYAPDTRTVALIGPTGVRRSGDGGTTFTTVRGRAVQRTRLSAYDRAGGATFAWGATELIRSLDRGRTWTTVGKPGRTLRRGGRRVNRTRIATVDFVDASTGFLRTDRGELYRTSSAGRRWARVESIGTTAFDDMAFSSARRGYLVVDTFGDSEERGYLLRTEDGGATWFPQLVAPSEIGSLAAPGGRSDYVLAGEATFLLTTTGGVAGRRSSVSIATDRRRLRRPARIRVTGTVRGAREGDLVVVSGRRDGRWVQQSDRMDRAGRYTTSWDLGRGTTRFVAQWAGNEASAGDGSAVLAVTVSRARARASRRGARASASGAPPASSRARARP